MNMFQDDVVVIFGGSSGIGKESAILFAHEGAQLILIARGTSRLLEAAEEIRKQGGRVDAITANVNSPQDIRKAAEMIKENYGRVDVMIYSAAVFYLSPVETLDLKRARESMEVIYWGALHVTQEFLPLIRAGKRKSMIFISSLSTHCTLPFFTAYASSKHALRGFVLSLRQELNPEGIHVGMVTPGPVETPLIENDLHQDMFRLPPGFPVLKPAAAAKAVMHTALKRKRDLVIPKRISFAARLSSAFPFLMEMYYRLAIPGWHRLIQSQMKDSVLTRNKI